MGTSPSASLVGRRNRLRERLGAVLAVALMAASVIAVAPMAQSVEGEAAFDRFRADVVGHEWTNAYLLSLMSYYVYADVHDQNHTYLSGEPFRQAFEDRFAPLGLTHIELVEDPGTDTQGIVAETNEAVFVIFRGTEQTRARDLETDLKFNQTPDGVHLGFAEAANSVLRDVHAKVSAALNRNPQGKKLWITGHSLGGALANVTAYYLATGTELQCFGLCIPWPSGLSEIKAQGIVTFGAPRVFNPLSVAGIRFAIDFASQNRVQRWVNQHDPVPHVIAPLMPPPPLPDLWAYAHLGNLQLIEIYQVFSVPDGRIVDACRIVSPFPHLWNPANAVPGLDDHFRYQTRIFSLMPAATRLGLPQPTDPGLPRVAECDYPPDNTLPSIVADVAGLIGNDNWFVGDVEVNWHVREDESDVTYDCPQTFIVEDTAGITLTCSATSQAGTTTASATIKRDATPPTVPVATPDRAPDVAGWYNAAFTVTWSATDALSGVDPADCDSTTYILGDVASGIMFGGCADRAGNDSILTAFGFRFDATDPVVGFAGNLGTYRLTDSIDISCSMSDAVSGIAAGACPEAHGPAYSFDFVAPITLNAWATDAAGNSAAAATSFAVEVSLGDADVVIHEFVDKASTANQLRLKLDKIATALPEQKAQRLREFENYVAGKVGKDGLTQGEADVLLAIAAVLANA